MACMTRPRSAAKPGQDSAIARGAAPRTGRPASLTWQRIALAGLLVLWSLVASSDELVPLVVADSKSDLRLGQHMLLIADPLRTLGFDEVAAGRHDARGVRPTSGAPNLGYTTHPYWVRFAFRNDSPDEIERLLVLWRGSKHMQTVRTEDAN